MMAIIHGGHLENLKKYGTHQIHFVLNEFLDLQNLLPEYNFIVLGSIVLEIWPFIPNDGHCDGHLENHQTRGSYQINFVLVGFHEPGNSLLRV